jgi:hypothetical protein
VARWSWRTATILGVTLVALGGGCPNFFPPSDNGNGNGNENGNGNTNDNTNGGTAEIVSPSTSFGLSALDAPVSVLYTVEASATNIRGFRVPVADSSVNSAPIGDRVITATDLPAGVKQVFSFDPQEAGVGFHRVGILYVLNGTEGDVESQAVIQVQGSPNPLFIQPTQALTQVVQGADVFISFDVSDPEGNAQWRLFYLSETDSRDNPADQLGIGLATGSGNVGTFLLPTTSLAPGDYQLGISATDSGSSVAITVATGESERIVTVPNDTVSTPILRVAESGAPKPPTIAITAPGATDVALYLDDPFTIRFNGAVHEAGATGTIEVFYDLDDNVGNGFTSIAPDLPVSTTSIPFPTGVAEGTYHVGASINDRINPSLTVYAAGKLSVVRTVTLDVTAPATSLPVAPGKTVDVKWTTNAPAGSGTVDVFAQTVDASGNPFGAELSVVNDGVITTKTAAFGSGTPGLFEITVRLNLKDGTVVQDAAPQHVRVTSLPPVLWLGLLADSTSGVDGAIFGGVNFEDNAGTSFSAVGDLDGDQLGEFLIGARYGKPFFTNPTGVGPGEAYLVYGEKGTKKLRGEYNLNSVGTTQLRGLTLAGIRTPEGNNETDGMSSVSRLPDVDGDGKDELVFGFPNTNSRGHNISPEQNGVVDPLSLATLEREKQFLRGGIVILSSTNSLLQDPSSGPASVNLDVVGQDFFNTCVDPEPGTNDSLFHQDVRPDITANPPCTGTCLTPASGGKPDASTYIDYGFVSALARDYFYTYVYSFEFYGGTRFCASVDPFLHNPCLALSLNVYCAPFTASCEPFSPGLHADAPDPDELFTFTRHSGFYTTMITQGTQQVRNPPLEPLGARIIGVGLGDQFGTSLTLSNALGTGAGEIIVSSPARTARGILLGPAGGPEGGGEIDGLESGGAGKINPDSGVAYIFGLRSLWTDAEFDRIPPKPHQYIVGEASHCGGPDPDGGAGPLPRVATIPNVDAIRIAGFAGDEISRIVGIKDFNHDGLNDFVIGAPSANGGQGRVYIGYRRTAGVEGDYVLEKLALDPTDPERLNGLLVVATSLDSFGASLAGGFDFNGDKIPDLVIGSPTAAGGSGEVIILFGGTGMVSPANGITIDNLLTTTRTSTGAPVAARIRGNALDTNGQFGFNLANAGDIDGDGLDDLLVAAPNATPRFDAKPNDATDEMTSPGLDLDFDGVRDEVPGGDDLLEAGLVYVIFGSNRLDQLKTCQDGDTACSTSADCPTGKACGSTNFTININQLGKSQLHGLIIAGRRAGDRIGGGDAGDTALGGIAGKQGRGRSDGLAGAGDVDGDKRADILIGSILADPRRDPNTGVGVQNGGEAYLIYGSSIP